MKSLYQKLFGKRKPKSGMAPEMRQFLAEALEARVLYSAAPVATPVEDSAPVGDSVPESEVPGFEGTSDFGFADVSAGLSEVTDRNEMVTLTSLNNLSADEITVLGVDPLETAQIPITTSTLDELADAAGQHWINSGLDAEQIAALDSIEYHIVELDGPTLGYAEGSQIYIDDDAAGMEWFVDSTPMDLSETGFSGIDLVSVLSHEVGHVLGLRDIYEAAEPSLQTDVMYGLFEEGERREIEDGRADGAEALSLEGAHYATVNATWSGGGDGTSWNDGANWSGTAPSNFGTLDITTGATINNVYRDGGATTLYSAGSTFRGTVNLNQGTIEIDHYFGTGPSGGGFNIGDGSGTADAIVNVVNGGTWELDRHASGTYTVNINSDGQLNATGTGVFQTYSNTDTRDWEINVNGGILTSEADWNMRGAGNDHNKVTISNGGSVNVGAITVTNTVIDFLDADAGGTFTAKYGGSFADIAAVNAAIGTTFIGSNGNPLVANDNGDGTFTLNALFYATVSFAANDATATENGDGGQFTVTMTEANDIATTITYNVTGTAASGTDFSALSGTVTIDAGETTATIDLSTLDNDIVEANETVIVTLTGVTAGNTGGRVVTIDGVGNVVYQSDFTGTTLASAGLVKSAGAAGGSWAIDDPNDQLDGVGSGNARASVYTSDSWQSDTGFTLEVTFWGSSALVRHSFGIVDAAYSIPAAVDSLNQSPAGAYGIGFATAGELSGADDGLIFNNDAGTATVLSTAQGNKTSAASETMSITVTATSWSYSLNGAPATTGTFATAFDTSRDYRFVAYAQRASRANFQNITLTEVPVTPGANTDTVTIADDDTAGYTISKTTGAVSEDGTTATDSFTVVLDSEPTSDVVILVTNPDTGEVTADAAALTFTGGNWDVAQTVNLTGVDDAVDDDDQSTILTLAVDAANSDDAFDALANQTFVVTTADDDTAGVTVSKAAATVSEDGTTTDNFTVILDSEPTSDVVLSITNPDTGEVTADAEALTFTSANWNVAQTVNLTGTDDPAADGDQNTTLTIAVDAANSDDAFDSLADQTVTVTTSDDDGTLITQTTGVTSNGTTLRVRDINGEDTADNLVISVDGTDLVVRDIAGNEIGTDVASGSSVIGISEIRFALNSFTNLKIEANGNDDQISIGDLTGVIGSVTVLGGDGFDTITLTGSSVLTSNSNASFTGEHIEGDTITLTTSGTGEINLTGSGGADPTTGSYHGVFLRESALTSDAGDITITGSGSDGSIFNDGVQLMQTNVSTTDASITISGTGSGGIRSKGVNLLAFPGGTLGSNLTVGGSGNLTIDGVGGTGSFQNEGVSVNNFSALSVVDGDISITGTGGAGSFGGVGVKFTSAMLSGSGDGNVTITGTSAATGGFFNGGIELKETTITTTGDGAGTGLVTIAGTGSGNGTLLNDGVKLLSTNITAGLNASIDIDGTSTGTTVGNNGVFMTTGVSLTVTGTGAISIDGTGSASGTVNNDGVFLGQTDLDFQNGDVNITGAGGTGSQGVQTVTANVTGTGSGNINIVGSSVGTKGINQGISLSSSTLTTAAGSGDVTLKGTGSANGSFSNDGILLSASHVITGNNASIDLEGVGGGSGPASGFFNNGIQLKANSSLQADGAGTVTLDGTGGVAALLNRGIWIQSGSDVTSGTGNIVMHGTGNGSTLFNQGIFLSAADVSTGGDITLLGTGSQTASSVFNTGVSIGGNVALNAISAGGTLNITGTGGTGSTLNEGVRFLGIALSGNLQVIGTSHPSTTSGVLNTGVYMLTVNLTATTVGSSITGFGGGLTSGVGNLHHGIYMNNITGGSSGFLGSTIGTKGFGALSKDKAGDFFAP